MPEPPDPTRPLSAVTVVCEAWPGEPPAEMLTCEDAARLALGAVGGDRAASVGRLDVRFGGACPDPAACPRSPAVRTVVARSASFDSLRLRVERTTSGELLVWPPVDGDVEPPPRFTPPAAVAPDLPSDAPIELREGPPLPVCGTELVTAPDAFDTTARRCFLDGVTAWAAVELVSEAVGTEGDPLVTVDRFTGAGAIRRFVRSNGGWSAAACAISPIDATATYLLVRPCAPIDLGP